MAKVIIIGNGSIGTELKRQVEAIEGWSLSYVFSIDKVLDKDGNVLDLVSNWKKYDEADVVFLAIPTDGGEQAFSYIDHFSGKDIPVVTCEKGALAYHFEKLLPYIRNRKLGYSATVGGGSRMLPYLAGRLIGGTVIDQMTGVLNGTLNYIFSRLSEGASEDEVLAEILERKYAEPGASTFETIIAGETGDLHKKGVILANVSGLMGTILQPVDSFLVDPGKLSVALKDPSMHRFLVMISREESADFICGIEYRENNWNLQIGLFNIEKIASSLTLPQGVNNALFIKEGESIFSVSGPGAGPVPTARAMITDAVGLLSAKLIQ